MNVFVTGASGLVGRRLCAALRGRGDDVVALTRSARPPTPGLRWVMVDPLAPTDWTGELAGCSAVVNLAGETIGQRWTPKRRASIFASRVRSTQALVEAIARLDTRPTVLISASAIGFYGTDPQQTFQETSPQGRGFLADLCFEWEKAALGAEALGVRVVRPRFGLVLSAEGGALPKLLSPLKLGVGAKLGSGEQWVSWILIDDLVALLLWALDTPAVRGAVNAVAPQPVRHRELMDTLGHVVGRRAWLRAPAPMIRLALGAMADEMLLSGQQVSSARAQAQGFVFRFPTLEMALRSIAELLP